MLVTPERSAIPRGSVGESDNRLTQGGLFSAVVIVKVACGRPCTRKFPDQKENHNKKEPRDRNHLAEQSEALNNPTCGKEKLSETKPCALSTSIYIIPIKKDIYLNLFSQR